MLITIQENMATTRRPHPKPPALSLDATIERRTRILRLQRPAHGSYGFHLRGGREHGTGFFISHVETGTEAYAHGLRTGDQVLRVNDLNVSGALHKEVAALVRAGTEVILHVKSTGLIPVKNNPEDPLSWILVEPDKEVADPLADTPTDFSKYHSGSLSSTGTNPASNSTGQQPVQIIVGGAGKHTIGCSICKGPPEKPGIFVQRVRERGIAEEAGLRAGDQILSCNGVSFLRTEFQQAVQAMKASPYLRLEVLRGAGLELVAGESSGYNSSASSETGEESYPTDSDYRDGFSDSLASTLTRLNGMRDRIQLDSNRDWKDIEAEWAEAEVKEKRTQLENSHTLLSRKLNLPNSVSKSYVNLTISEMDEEQPYRHHQLKQPVKQPHPQQPQQPQYTTTCSNCSQPLPPPTQRSSLTKPRSMIDLRESQPDASYKIAMQMATDEHVSKIVIPSAPKDERNAVRRLEQLSIGSKCSTLQNHNKTCSISSTSSDESTTHGLYADHLRPSLGANLKETRQQLVRCRSVPQDSDTDSLLSCPSSTISVCQSPNGGFTSKVTIRSPPPPPPPRGDSTKLTRHHRRLKGAIHRRPGVTPPESPCTSSNGSDAVFKGHSFESLSLSSDEGTAPWDPVSGTHQTKLASSVPPAPPLPSSFPSSIPPPPPLPSLQVPSNGGSSLCGQVQILQQEISDGAARLKSRGDRPEIKPKKPLPDPNKLQHEKLMEEFKKAHALMVSKREAC